MYAQLGSKSCADNPQSFGRYYLHQSPCKVEGITPNGLDQSELPRGSWVDLTSPMANGQIERCTDLSIKKGELKTLNSQQKYFTSVVSSQSKSMNIGLDMDTSVHIDMHIHKTFYLITKKVFKIKFGIYKKTNKMT